jgi:hypothetical protein
VVAQRLADPTEGDPMRKIVAITVAAGALVALAVLGAGAFAASPAKQAGHGWARVAGAGADAASAARGSSNRDTQHLVLFARFLREQQVDVGPSGESTGDSVFFEDALLNGAGKRVGKDAAQCTLGIRTFNCGGTMLVYGKGKIQVDGAFFADRDSVLPVTGGTGAFKGVGGQLVISDGPGNLERYDFFLVR